MNYKQQTWEVTMSTKNKHVAKSQIHNDVDVEIYHKQKKQH
jgi:hypothetical protein